MSIGPLLLGRLPTSLMTSRLARSLQFDQTAISKLQEQLSSGRKFALPGESPGPALRTMAMQKLLERQSHFKTNVTTDRSFLMASEASLGTVTDVLDRAKALVQMGIGLSATPAEKQAMAAEAGALVRSLVNVGNTRFQGRYLFAGSQTNTVPFTIAGGAVRYAGDTASISSLIDFNLLLANNVDGNTALGAMTEPIGNDVNPALTLDTKTADLDGGQGIELGSIVITLQNGGPAISKTIDLSGADTVRDLKTRIESAFAAEAITLTVDVNPLTGSGLRLTPSAGTVAVSDAAGSTTAAALGITSAASATINGADLDPALTTFTPLSALNGGAGIGPTAGFGLAITNGEKSQVVDISSAVTVGDLLNLLRQTDLDLDASINTAGNGLAISSRLSGARFSIGENNGTNAAALGIRTFDGSTRLADLNLGQGVPVADQMLKITRRDGTLVEIDLSSAATVQDVLNTVNAVDPGNLVAGLNAVGNGISLTDNSGAGPLTVEANAVGMALGIDGTENSGIPATALVGRDIHPRQANGAISLLLSVEQALAHADDRELTRLGALIEKELERVNLVRGELGSRLRLLDQTENRLLDQDVEISESLSKIFDADLTEVITQMVNRQQILEATMQITAQTMNMSLLNYL